MESAVTTSFRRNSKADSSNGAIPALLVLRLRLKVDRACWEGAGSFGFKANCSRDQVVGPSEAFAKRLCRRDLILMREYPLKKIFNRFHLVIQGAAGA